MKKRQDKKVHNHIYKEITMQNSARRMSKLFLYFYYSISLALHVAHNNMKKKVSNNNFTEVPIYQRFTFLI